ncbi:MAG: HD domain-containing protein [Solirubrobacterales bacterium]|nr:HD domain-containing protein [Solirubrobacterales bacterium]MCB8970641.1 HD domain-containing protein [Thermoleophilales bacterium]MCO5326431.1 HD domain-containing protein [Solirubrobacterales bacterium]
MRDAAESTLAAAAGVRAARAALGDRDDAWVVGGAVRDAFCGDRVADVDLAVAGDVERAARAIAGAEDGHAFELSAEFDTWRVAAREGGWTLDVAGLRGTGIEADLALRDFTVNAIAVPLGGGPPIDPTGGLADLEARRLRAVSARSFEDDPLRLLRAARLAAGLGLALDEGTVALARAAAGRAGEPAGERQLAELAALVAGPDPTRGIELLADLDALPGVLPELDALRGVGQSANHHLDAYGHTIEVLRRLLVVEADLQHFAGDVSGEVAAILAQPLADGLTRGGALRFAALLHDIGKPATRVETDEGWVSFKGHDRVGAEMVRKLFRRLRSSRALAGKVAAMTRDHLVLGFMVRDRPLPPRRVFGYLERCGDEVVETTLLTVADRLSAQGGGVPEWAIEGHLELAREMLGVAVPWELEGPPKPLLRGDEIGAEAGIEPGPALGEAVRELAAAQWCGEVSTREQAIAHMRDFTA